MNLKFLFALIIVLGTCCRLSAQVTGADKPVTAADLDYRKDGNNYLLVLKAGQTAYCQSCGFYGKGKIARCKPLRDWRG
ncbi:hypothetical protein [Mucilaginibacter lappiensis]|uniref:hypothetical protein n=1 Tax=Mucilaginibacter lappiensis TaxID=354630 RepID=UPI003D1D63C5